MTSDATRADPIDDDEPTVPASTTPPGDPPEGQDPDASLNRSRSHGFTESA